METPCRKESELTLHVREIVNLSNDVATDVSQIIDNLLGVVPEETSGTPTLLTIHADLKIISDNLKTIRKAVKRL